MKFQRPYGIDRMPVKKVLKWKLRSLLRNKDDWDDGFRLTVFPLTAEALQREDDFIVWLGHATFYLQLGGVRIITDPVFGEIPMVPPRLIPFPIDPESLDPDIILISHGHYDHFDTASLKTLDIYRKKRKVILPPGLSSYLKRGADSRELDWYEHYRYDTNLTITALPAAHWHRRGLFDFNRALWCSFLIHTENKTIYFAGDSAFDRHFAEIAQKAGSPKIALMPIGAYEPAELMRLNHMNPEEAIEAAKILGARTIIPYHYGTFRLSDETPGDPYRRICRLAEMAKTEKAKQKIDILLPGQIRSLASGR